MTYIEWDRSQGEDAYIVKYIEPSGVVTENNELIGLNIGRDQKRLDLFNNVRDEDPTSTGHVALIATPRKGFEVILPVYLKGPAPTTVEDRRAALKGFIQVEFAGDKLFQEIFNVVDSINLSFEVYSSQPSKENLLYEQGLDHLSTNPDYKPKITRSDTFEFNGQTWYLLSATKPDYKLTSSQERLPLIVLGSGLIMSFVYLGVFLYLKKNLIT